MRPTDLELSFISAFAGASSANAKVAARHTIRYTQIRLSIAASLGRSKSCSDGFNCIRCWADTRNGAGVIREVTKKTKKSGLTVATLISTPNPVYQVLW